MNMLLDGDNTMEEANSAEDDIAEEHQDTADEDDLKNTSGILKGFPYLTHSHLLPNSFISRTNQASNAYGMP